MTAPVSQVLSEAEACGIVSLLGDIAMWSGNAGLIQKAFALAHPEPTAVQWAGAIADLQAALRDVLDHYERNICHHENTHRGGAIWTICDDCDTKWADDRGGFVPFEYPPEIKAAQALASAALAKEQGK